VVECGGLENRYAGIPRIEGSNPSPSAMSWADVAPVTWGALGPALGGRQAGVVSPGAYMSDQ
jgi:hypothetical protein